MKAVQIATSLFILSLTSCMADWVDLPAQSSQNTADASQGQDGSANGDAPQGADAGGVSCDTPSKDRLRSNGDGTFHDLLLDLDCSFFMTTGHGKRCVPFYSHAFGSDAFGNSDLPEANPVMVYQSEDCKEHQVFLTKADPKGRFPRYGFQMDLTTGTTIGKAYNLVDPQETTVTIHNPLTGKAAGLTGLHNDNKTTCPVRTDDYANPDWSFMLADKAASFEACPQATGLDLFAEQSL